MCLKRHTDLNEGATNSGYLYILQSQKFPSAQPESSLLTEGYAVELLDKLLEPYTEFTVTTIANTLMFLFFKVKTKSHLSLSTLQENGEL